MEASKDSRDLNRVGSILNSYMSEFKMKRRYIHHVDYRIVVCTEKTLVAEPGAWADCRPRDWTPRRVRRIEWFKSQNDLIRSGRSNNDSGNTSG